MSAASAALASEDPTGTKSLRQEFEAEYNRRWRELRGELRDHLENNARLRPSSDRSQARQTGEFRDYLEHTIDDIVVEPLTTSSVLAGNHVTASFIERAYTHGIRLGNAHLRRAGVDVDPLDQNDAEALAHRPYYREQLEREWEATYDDLQDAGRDTHADTSRTYRNLAAAGVGISPLLTGRSQTEDGLNNRVDKVGQTATHRMTHGRVVQTVNEAAVLTYQNAGVDSVGVIPELSVETTSQEGRSRWSTAQDSRVCEQCSGLEGQTWTTSEIMQGDGMLPVRDTHGFCRCLLIPSV